MTQKRFTMSQNGNFHTVRDTVEKKPLGMFEFKENEFPVYACFHHIIDLLNEFYDENEQLKQRNNRQYEQLNKLWKLIEKGDWETLTAMDKKMKEDEERLQKEWGTYSD